MANKTDLNTAGRDELVALPRIGDAGADAILKYRKEHGRFAKVDDLVHVPGIGAATVKGARYHLTASRDDKAAARGGDDKQGEGRAEDAAARETAEETSRSAQQAAAGAGGAQARRAEDAVARDVAALADLGRSGAEEMAGAGQALLGDASEFGQLWVSYWNEQLADGMATARELTECRTWQDALEVQNAFARASFERAWTRMNRSTELAARMFAAGGFEPLQRQARAAARSTKSAA